MIAMPFDSSFFSPARVAMRKLKRKHSGVITLSPSGKPRGRLLLSYVTHPFAISLKELLATPHTNPHECLEIADTFLGRDYAIDVIDWTNLVFMPKKKYDVAIDVHQNLERLGPYLPHDCVKIFYITGAHWLYQNLAELTRLQELKTRRGVVLMSRRQMNPSRNIECADYATALGNDFARETYAFAKKRIAQIPLFSTTVFPSPQKKDFRAIRKNFVWIGGGGAVHKGLDRVLECFTALPDFHLTVCGPVEGEEDFFTFYRKELMETPNIKFVGRIDVRGAQFNRIIDQSVALVYPSCSEGQSGSVITGLHAGLIPIVTRQSGVDVEPFGITLQTASVEEIRAAVKTVAALPENEMRDRALGAWTYAQTYHTRETFRHEYARFVDRIFAERHL